MRSVVTCGVRAAVGFVALACLPVAGDLHGQAPSYLDYDGLTRELRTLVNGSNLATMRSLGLTSEGREIWLVEIANRSGAPLDQRPGLLVVGNLEGDHVVGSALALETARYLVATHDDEPELERLLREQVFYVIPRLNPDGAQGMFAGLRSERTRNARPFDDDNDGRTDEDPPEDLNGDGLITVMRVPDPFGEYLIDPEESRLMKRADASKGESGGYTLYWEGRDSDGDGFVNEDGIGGVDLNRNFQHAYPYWQRDAGPYMVSEPESRALADFMIAHGNVAAILAFGLSDNLVTAPDARGTLAAAATLDLAAFADASNAEVFTTGVFSRGGGLGGFGDFGGFFFGGGGGFPRLRGAQPGRDNDPSSGRRPATTVNTQDLTYFSHVSEAYREITGIEKVGLNRAAEGAFFQYGYFQFGVPSFSTQGWGLPKAPESEESADEEEAAADPEAPAERPEAEAGRRPPGGMQGRAPGGLPMQEGGGRSGAAAAGGGFDATLLKAMDDAGIDGFVTWTPFTHPDLGAVEIGGFRPYAITNPPAEQLPELGRTHGAFAVRLASMLPRVRIAKTEVTNHGGGIFTVEVEVENTGYFPTTLQHGVVSRSVDPTMVQIQVDPDAVLTGDDKTSYIPRLDGSGARERFSWVIRGRAGASVEVRVRSQKGGTETATVTLR